MKLILLLAFLLSGCSGLFLYPDREDYFPKVSEMVTFQEGFIPTPDGQQLHYWLIPAQTSKTAKQDPKGLVIQVHGNAQNLSAHVRGLGWLTAAGYNLAIFDYRGYGRSTGSASLDSAYNDVATALDFITTNLNPTHLPVYFYGQSLGGTLLLKNLSVKRGHWSPKLVIIESSFYSYTQIAREKLASTWLTWPFQWLAWLTISDRFSLKDEELRTLSPTPSILFYSEHDPVVPIEHGQKIFAGLAEPKKFYSFPEPGHVAAMWVQSRHYRTVLLEAMLEATQKKER